MEAGAVPDSAVCPRKVWADPGHPCMYRSLHDSRGYHNSPYILFYHIPRDETAYREAFSIISGQTRSPGWTVTSEKGQMILSSW